MNKEKLYEIVKKYSYCLDIESSLNLVDQLHNLMNQVEDNAYEQGYADGSLEGYVEGRDYK